MRLGLYISQALINNKLLEMAYLPCTGGGMHIGSPLRTRLSRQRPPSMRALRAGRERASLLGRPSPLRTPLSGRPCALWPCGPVTLRTRPQRGVMCSKKHPHTIHNGLMLHHNSRKPTEVTCTRVCRALRQKRLSGTRGGNNQSRGTRNAKSRRMPDTCDTATRHTGLARPSPSGAKGRRA